MMQRSRMEMEAEEAAEVAERQLRDYPRFLAPIARNRIAIAT